MTIGWYLILGGLALLIPTAYAGLIGAPYAPTRMRVVRKAFDELGIHDKDVVVDLGVGDGSILLEAASRGARAYGYELSPIMWCVAWVRSLSNKNASVYYGNFFKNNISDATVVFIFLLPKAMPAVLDYIKKQDFPQGRLILSYGFSLANAVPVGVVKAEKCLPLYVYDLKQLTTGESTGTQQQ